MTSIAKMAPLGVERARLSRGASSSAIHAMVARALASRGIRGGVLLDVGCGRGDLWHCLRDRFDSYIGADVADYPEFPADARFVAVDLDSGLVPLADGVADVVVAVETIEHLENPRRFTRELVRLARPGGWVVVTTPNQLSLLSKLTLLVGNEFNAFRANSYPAHLTALLEIDLSRIAAECGLTNAAIAYSERGRIAFTPRHYPRWLSRLWPRAFSDNVLAIGCKPCE